MATSRRAAWTKASPYWEKKTQEFLEKHLPKMAANKKLAAALAKEADYEVRQAMVEGVPPMEAQEFGTRVLLDALEEAKALRVPRDEMRMTKAEEAEQIPSFVRWITQCQVEEEEKPGPS
ncbi:MAG: DUF1896 family protein [Fimbriimonadaceae bacterium]|nr:DUF1896 family protein [Fimbriimonadaceae bacterium]QYK55222.1 MAG: DUF1896 family protein [Fimbriimonadaceae bacterium]